MVKVSPGAGVPLSCAVQPLKLICHRGCRLMPVGLPVPAPFDVESAGSGECYRYVRE